MFKDRKDAGKRLAKALEQYKDKKIEDLFPNHNIVRNNMGQFMEIVWEEAFQCDLKLSHSKNKILQNLKTVYYIFNIHL